MTLANTRHVELNPVRAELGRKARDWRWSSAKAHLAGKDDVLARIEPLLNLAAVWKRLLAQELSEAEKHAIRGHERTGRPLGDTKFLQKLEKRLGRVLQPLPPGPKPKGKWKRR